MKWLRTLVIFDRGAVVSTSDWHAIHAGYVRAIRGIDFPENSGTLTLRKKAGGQRNGVGYLRQRFLSNMQAEGWRPEEAFDLGAEREPLEIFQYAEDPPHLSPHAEKISSKFGGFDFVTSAPEGSHVAIEWETGNISSSHRSLNKLAIALKAGRIQVGVLIVPSRDLYRHLTDRIGNVEELSAYLSMWRELGSGVERGVLAISVVEHDALTSETDFPFLPTGADGRSKKGKAKRKRKAVRVKKLGAPLAPIDSEIDPEAKGGSRIVRR